MRWEWLLGLVGLAQPVLLVVLVPRRWLGRAMALWLALPVPVWAVVVLRDLAEHGAPPNLGQNLAFGFGLVMTTVGAAWVVGSGVAFLIGLGLRRMLRPGERATTVPPAPAPAPAPAAPRPPSPAGVLPNGAALEIRESPDGRFRAAIDAVEWSNSHWVRSPRIEDRTTGAVLLDLLGTDWDASVGFDTPGQVWLGLRRYRAPGAWTLVLDAVAGTATLVAADSPSAGLSTTFPLAEAGARLEAASRAMLPTGLAFGAPPPHPLAAWRTALAILVLAVAAIAGLTWATLPAKSPQVLDKLPAFPPAAPR